MLKNIEESMFIKPTSKKNQALSCSRKTTSSRADIESQNNIMLRYKTQLYETLIKLIALVWEINSKSKDKKKDVINKKTNDELTTLSLE